MKRSIRKRITKIQYMFKIVLLLLAGIGFGCCDGMLLKVQAASGEVFFGSDSYMWNTGDVVPIGVYFRGDLPVNSYSVCLEYDPAVLNYLNGADRVEGNLIYLDGGGGEAEYKRMLHFEPIAEGETSLRVVAAVGMGSIQQEDGTVLEEEIVIGELRQAPIYIQRKGSSRLLQLVVPNADGMEAFSPDELEYHMEVAYEIETLDVQYVAEDELAGVEVSGQALKVGSNAVMLTVRGEGVEPMVYTLHVERKEEAVVSEKETAEPESQTGNGSKGETVSEESVQKDKGQQTLAESVVIPDEELQENKQIQSEASDREEAYGEQEKLHPVLAIAVGIVGLMTVLYAVWYFSKYKKQDTKDEKKEQKEDDIKVINFEQTVIDIRHVTMRFRQAQDEASSLKEYLIRMLKGQNHYKMLTALNDITFEVKQGDVLGVIGTNGSGKSTLLKIVAGALHPSEGEVVVDKDKVQMLTLGTGFDMELTARENVYLNGAIIGFSKEYIDEKYDDIVAFAELDGFMDERMKNFSSGMVSRLGFAIATMRDTPDILILDEVLSVGDMFFRKKSEKRIREMIHSGATVLIVSHSADVIRKNCDKAVWIEKGILRMVGKPDEVCKAYEGMGNEG